MFMQFSLSFAVVLSTARGANWNIPHGFGTLSHLARAIASLPNPVEVFVTGMAGIPLMEAVAKRARPLAGLPSACTLLVMGNEGQGTTIQQVLPELPCVPITIPMAPLANSLNVSVAGSICMHALKSPGQTAAPPQKAFKE